ncbi:hypothetical protein Hanom_Chr00s000327g01637531 [Helianthus anomalus]
MFLNFHKPVRMSTSGLDNVKAQNHFKTVSIDPITDHMIVRCNFTTANYVKVI